MIRYKKMHFVIWVSLVVLVICSVLIRCNSSTYRTSYLDELPAPSIPTVFLFTRNGSDDRHFGLEKEIIEAAKYYLEIETGTGSYENVVIIDEGDYWYVYFGKRGNGIMEAPRKGAMRRLDGSDAFQAVYLHKYPLDIATVPENNIEVGLSLFGQRIDQLPGMMEKNP